MPSTSVVMATYNGANFIEDQLDSVLSQSVSPDEVLIFDDCSTDGTDEIIESYIQRHALHNWSFHANTENLGFRVNFRNLAFAAKSDYIFFCDQDDIWLSEKIERCVAMLESNPDIQVLCTEFDLVHSSDMEGVRARYETRKSSSAAHTDSIEAVYPHFGKPYIWLGCAMAIRRSFLEYIKPYWPSTWAHDECMWILAQVVDGCHIAHQTLTLHRIHSSNATGQKVRQREKRIALVREKGLGAKEALAMIEEKQVGSGYAPLFSKMLKCSEARVSFLENHSLRNLYRMIGSWEAYPEKKSLLIDIAIGMGLL